MKKIFLCALLVFTTSMSTSVFASNINVFLNGKRLKITESPVIENGTVMVPFRDIFEAIGMEVSWDATTNTVSGNKNGTKVVLSIGNHKGYVNGSEQSLTVSPEIINGTTMVPLRFVAESAGYFVNWDSDNSRVIIGGANVVGNAYEYMVGDITLSDGKLINAADLYTVDGTGAYVGYKHLMGHPYEDVADLYFKTSTDGSEGVWGIDVVPKYYDGNQYIKWNYKGKSYGGTKKDVYTFINAHDQLGEGKECKNIFGSIYDEWFDLQGLEFDGGDIIIEYTHYLNGISQARYDHNHYYDNFDVD